MVSTDYRKGLAINLLKGKGCGECRWLLRYNPNGWCYMISKKPAINICKFWKVRSKRIMPA